MVAERTRGLLVGLTTLDSGYYVRKPPGPDEKVVALRHEMAAGGPAANAAVTFAALGGRATLLTSLGGHVLARAAAADLTERGVRIVDATPGRQSAPPLAAVVVAETGERSVVATVDDTADAQPPEDLAPLVGDVVLVDGHHPALALAAARAAHDAGVPVVLDAGSWKPVLEDLLPLCTVVACSAQFRLPGSPDRVDTVRRLVHDHALPAVVVTDGPRPVQWWSEGRHGTVPVRQVTARDTLGAGDAFHGALAWACPRMPLPEAVALAAEVATIRVAHEGLRAWLDGPALARLRREIGDA